MKSIHLQYIAWLTLLFAVLAWTGVGYVYWTLSSASEIVSGDSALLEQSAKGEAEVRILTLARDTRMSREALEQFADTDIVSIVEFIEQAGRDAGATVKISQVLAGARPTSASPDVPTTRPVSLILDAEGAFTPLIRFVSLLYALPLSSSVEYFNMEYETATPGRSAFWRLTTRLKVLTTSDL